MKLNLHFLEAEGSLNLWRETLNNQVKDTAALISAKVPLAFSN